MNSEQESTMFVKAEVRTQEGSADKLRERERERVM